MGITRKEAIQELKLIRANFNYRINGTSIFDKALEYAIASLETDEAYQLMYEQPEFCKNCISREAVYYYISSHIHEIITESGTDKNAHTNAILRSLANGIKTMPSVLPKAEKQKGHWIFVDKAHEHARCSECDYGNVDLLDGRPHNYCPNCGSRNVVEE